MGYEIIWDEPFQNSKVFVQYTIYKNDNFLVSTVEVSYLDTDGDINDRYCVVANYTEGDSDPICITLTD